MRERDKAGMLQAGKWVPRHPGRRVRGYHLNALYSPWRSWSDVVEEWVKVGKNPERLKVFVNTVLAESWEERGDGMKADRLRDRLETFDADVPAGVGFLTCSVDVQGDRLEALVVGWGVDDESWVVAFEQFHGDPAKADVWHELTRFLARDFKTSGGGVARVETTVIDSGGAHTDEVYRFCAAALAGGRRVFPIKGGSTTGRPLVERPSTSNKYRVPLFVLCVDTGKETVLSRLQVAAPGSGFVHLPAWLDDEFLEQLTSEKAVRRYLKGRGAVRVWVKTRERNEAFDLMVYALAAFKIAGENVARTIRERAARLAQPGTAAAPVEDVADGTVRAPVQRPKGSWVQGWRR